VNFRTGTLLFVFVLLTGISFGQMSIATDASLLRNFNKPTKVLGFWANGAS
jgi:hypothetical protein